MQGDLANTEYAEVVSMMLTLVRTVHLQQRALPRMCLPVDASSTYTGRLGRHRRPPRRQEPMDELVAYTLHFVNTLVLARCTSRITAVYVAVGPA
jgi:hypothetical protein